jgi:hypothetical protein
MIKHTHAPTTSAPSTPALTQQTHPLFNLGGDDLNKLTQLKRGSQRVALALLGSQPNALITEAGIKMSSCADELIRDDQGRLRAKYRCKRPTCPHCLNLKGFKKRSQVISALRALPALADEAPLAARRSMKVIKVNLNGGSACTLEALPERLDAIHEAWGKLMRSRAISEISYGGMRATEITPSGIDRAHPHIHGFILASAHSSTSDIVEHIHRAWKRIIKRIYKRQGFPLPMLSSSVDGIEELTEQTTAHLEGWLTYITKGSFDLLSNKGRTLHASATKAYWQRVEEITAGRRMTSACGELRDALAKAKAEHEANRANCYISLTPSEAVAVWCDREQGYVEPNQATQPLNKLMNAVSYAEIHPNLSLIFQAERVYQQTRASEKARQRALLLVAYGAEMVERASAHQLKNDKLCLSKTLERQVHWSEPPERHRAPPSAPDKAPSKPQTNKT